MSNLSTFFQIKERGSSVKTEFIAGLTTFMSMSYILAVAPNLLSIAGMDQVSVFAATAISAAITTAVMAFLANLPVALAPGMGILAFFTFSVVLGDKVPWESALAAVFIAGVIFLALSLTNFRQAIFNCIPLELKYAISGGIGLFIAFIGLQASGIIVDNPATLVGMGDLTAPGAMLTLIGLALVSVLYVYNVTGALLIGIIIATLIGIPLGVTDTSKLVEASFFTLPSFDKTFMQFDFSNIMNIDMLLIIFTFFLINLFDTLGTLVGVAAKGNLLDKKGQLPQAKNAFLTDAFGTVLGAILGVSTVTSYIESTSGIAAGGRTGLTALVTAALFALALFLAPLFLLIPAQATAPALIIVGLFMLSSVVKIDFLNFTVGIPAFLTIIGMPLTYSVAYSIGWGIISYVFLMLCQGRAKELHPIIYVVCAMFIWRFVS